MHAPSPITKPARVASNGLIARVVELFPTTFVGVCQLPQVAGELNRGLVRNDFPRAAREKPPADLLHEHGPGVGRAAPSGPRSTTVSG